ncbi:hypothetical protein AgCh_014097 [Apium graveolens]
MLALPDGKGDFVKCSDASHKGLGCVLMQHGKKELNICQRRQLELIKNNDWEILYHSGKANMVADALSKNERLKMIMSFGEFIRDFEKMEIVVKVTGAGTEKLLEIAIETELLEKSILCQKKVMNEGREPTHKYEINTEKDDKGIMRARIQNDGMFEINAYVVLVHEIMIRERKKKEIEVERNITAIEFEARQADNRCYLLEAIWIDLNLNKDAIMKLGIDYRGGNDEYDNLSRIYDLIYSWKDAGKAKEVADTLKDEVVERKMLGSAVVQRTKDMIDLIRGRLVVAQDGHDTKGQRV